MPAPISCMECEHATRGFMNYCSAPQLIQDESKQRVYVLARIIRTFEDACGKDAKWFEKYEYRLEVEDVRGKAT